VKWRIKRGTSGHSSIKVIQAGKKKKSHPGEGRKKFGVFLRKKSEQRRKQFDRKEGQLLKRRGKKSAYPERGQNCPKLERKLMFVPPPNKGDSEQDDNEGRPGRRVGLRGGPRGGRAEIKRIEMKPILEKTQVWPRRPRKDFPLRSEVIEKVRREVNPRSSGGGQERVAPRVSWQPGSFHSPGTSG